MAYRYGDRDQMQLLPSSVGEYVTPADPVRVYDAFVDSLDLDELGIIEDEHKVGNSAQTGERPYGWGSLTDDDTASWGEGWGR